MGYLVLIRHGESTYNAKNVWTGWLDPPLTPKGIEQASQAGELIKDIKFNIAYTSDLLRAQETLEKIKEVLGQDIPTVAKSALKERNYGDYTNKNKDEVRKSLGDVDYNKLHRGWDYPVPSGESLKEVYVRVAFYYQQEILPKLKQGKNVLIAAHGNSIRALVKYLEDISDQDIEKLEIPLGGVLIYQIDAQGRVASKETRKAKS